MQDYQVTEDYFGKKNNHGTGQNFCSNLRIIFLITFICIYLFKIELASNLSTSQILCFGCSVLAIEFLAKTCQEL